MMVEHRSGHIAVIRPAGRLDRLAAPELEAEFSALVAGGNPRLVVDLAAVSFIDSSGLGALISGLGATRRAGGDLRIARLDGHSGALFRLTALDRVLRLYATVEDALAGYA